jgi:hypothetical protein
VQRERCQAIQKGKTSSGCFCVGVLWSLGFEPYSEWRCLHGLPHNPLFFSSFSEFSSWMSFSLVVCDSIVLFSICCMGTGASSSCLLCKCSFGIRVCQKTYAYSHALTLLTCLSRPPQVMYRILRSALRPDLCLACPLSRLAREALVL